MEHDFDLVQSGPGRKRDRAYNFIQLAGRILNGETQTDDGPAIAAGNPESGHHARERAANSQEQEAADNPSRHPLIDVV